MKTILSRNSAILLSLAFVTILLVRCGNDDEDPKVSSELAITGFTPAEAAIGSFITINGTGFSETPADNVVSFNATAEATAQNASSTSITVQVPEGATTGKLTVKVSGKTVTSTDDFTVLAPTITSFNPTQGIPGTTITISGTNFSSTASSNVVKFNGVPAAVQSSTGAELFVTVPATATTGTITVTVSGNTATSTQEFVVLVPNSWQSGAVTDFGGVGRTNVGFALVINGKAYIGASGQNDSNQNLKDFWEYNPQTNSWTQKATFTGTDRNGASGFAVGSKGYVGMGFSSGVSLKDLWEYNPATNAWTQKADLDGDVRSGAASFAIGDKGYVGLGTNGNYLTDFWQYDPATDKWTQKTAFKGSARAYTAHFVIGSKAYVGLGQTASTAPRDFWEYDPVTNDWVVKKELPVEASSSTTTFSVAGRGYLGGAQKQLWQYNPTTNEWIQKADVPDHVGVGVGFAINNFGYLGLGSNTGGKLKKFYRYIPD